MANTKLSFTPSQDGTRTKYTFSFWIKRSGLSSGQSPIVSSDLSNSNNTYSMIYFVNDVLAFYSTDNGQTLYFLTNQKFRDVNGWYHIVVAYDSPQATSSNRVKMYVNGEQITSWDTASYPSQNADNTWFNRAYEMVIGTRSYDNNTYFDGVMSHFHFCDGYAYSASDFGSTDATTGEWKINTSPNVNYGTNGFFILKDGNSVTDQSNNSNNWTVASGTLTKTEDNPSNVFCTLNSLAKGTSAPTFSMGNNRVVATATSYQFSCGTLAIPLYGKWYWEVKADNNVNGSSSEYLFGAVLESRLQASSNFAEFASDGISQYGSVSPNIGANDIISVAVDRTAATLKIYKNDSLILTKTSLPTELIFPMVTVFGSGVNAYSNFGNGYFGTTAVSSPGTNASNLGIFEYDVPTGYTALCTKGLNE